MGVGDQFSEGVALMGLGLGKGYHVSVCRVLAIMRLRVSHLSMCRVLAMGIKVWGVGDQLRKGVVDK